MRRTEARAITGTTPVSVRTRMRARSPLAPRGRRTPLRSTTRGSSRPVGSTKPVPISSPSRPASRRNGSTSSRVSPNASKARRFGSTQISSTAGRADIHA